VGLSLFLKPISNSLPLVALLPVVNLLQVSAQVPALGEILVAELTGEGALAGVLSKMVPQIARLFKDTPTFRVHALEEELLSLSLWILDPDGLMPLAGDAFEALGRLIRLHSLLAFNRFDFELFSAVESNLFLFFLNQLD
jgi:hypothetical protein